ncbi:hypothetical protein BEWA_013770 [Theileria equi strain WA]|uniref:Signal peptide containing protein n=1 Tax=Theileria equi strain WA TaxID=1537102 RepID=L1LCE2_THEEQ|nr:hypothetical protein BEWA_013770 [Theileria equi strain WA]EKX72818.1 hypothetical protein BEWA_013770 [Theileria equi strain WA]|eukprot:XP_004832270.1 hypothetical protein BEWA_013770 [Theileria equi strain WA]
MKTSTLKTFIYAIVIYHINLVNCVELNISKYDEALVKALDCYYDDIPTRFFFPKSIPITTITDGSTKLWSAKRGEECRMIIVRLRGTRPVVIHISPMDSKTCLKRPWVEIHRSDEAWKTGFFSRLLFTHLKRDKTLVDLKEFPRSTDSFSLDLSLEKDTEKCVVADYHTGNLPCRIHIPQISNYASEVRFGDEDLWRASEYGEYCTSAVTMLEKGKPRLIQLIFSDSSALNAIYCMREDYGWIHILGSEFEEKMVELLNEATAHEYADEDLQKASGYYSGEEDDDDNINTEEGLSEKLLSGSKQN